MRVQVTFRINTETGEVEFFQVDDMGRTRQVHDHDALHEDIALAIAQLVDPRADVSEVIPMPGQIPVAAPIPASPASQRQAQELDPGGQG
jgi:FtsH ternary system domain X3